MELITAIIGFILGFTVAAIVDIIILRLLSNQYKLKRKEPNELPKHKRNNP